MNPELKGGVSVRTGMTGPTHRPHPSSQQPPNGNAHGYSKAYEQFCTVTPVKSGQDRQFTPAEVSDLQLRSVPSHGIGPLSLHIDTPTGSYQSCESKESPLRTLASTGGSQPSQSPTPRRLVQMVADTSPDKVQTSWPAAQMHPHSAFEHPPPMSAYSQPSGGPALQSWSSLRAHALPSESATPNPASSGASLCASQQGSIREEVLYEDPLCMPLPPGGCAIRGREVASGKAMSPLASPSSGQVHGSHGPVRHYHSRPSTYVVAPTSGSAATAAAVAASQGQTQRRVTPVPFVKETRVSSVSSQDSLCWPQSASGAYIRSVQALQSDRSISEAGPAHTGMQVMLPAEPSLPGLPVHQSSTSSGTSWNPVNAPPSLHCITPNTGSQSSDSLPKLPGFSQQDSHANSGVVHQQTISLSQTTAASTPPSNTNVHVSDKYMSNRFDDAQEHSPAALVEPGVPDTKPTLRGGRHAYVSPPVPSAEGLRANTDSNNEEDSDHSAMAQLDVSFVFADSDCTDVGVDGPMDDAACQHDMEKAVGNRVQQFLSSNKNSAEEAMGDQKGGDQKGDQKGVSSTGKESRSNWGVSDRSRPRSSSNRSHQAPTATRSSPGRIRHNMSPAVVHSDREPERSVSTRGTTKVALGGHIRSFPVVTVVSQHPAEATRADVSPRSRSNSARSGQEAGGRHLCAGDRHHMMPQGSNDPEPGARLLEGSKDQTGVSIEHHADGDRVLCQLEAVRTSVSPRRTSRQGAQQSTQHASYSRTTQPQSLDRKASLSSQHSFPIVEACTMDALAAQQSGSIMSAYKLPAPGSSQSRTGLPPSGVYNVPAPRSRSRHDHPVANAYGTAAPSSSSQPRDYSAEYYANGANSMSRTPVVGMDTIESQKSTRSQRLNAPRPKPTDNFPPGSRITPHMLNAAFSSAPNITLDMIAAKSRAGAALRAEDSMMSDAALDSAMTTATSIGGVLNNLVDHSESARLENAPQNPFRDTMDSINSQVRPPRLGGNELFNSHLRSFRETLAMAGRPPPSSSSTGQPPSSDKESHREKYQPLAPGSIGGSSGQVALDSVAPPNRTMPMQPRSTDGRECSSVSSVTQAHAGAGPVRKLDMHTIHRASDHSEHRSEVRSRHPTPPHAALRSSTRGSDTGSSQTHIHAQTQPSLRYQSRLEPQAHGTSSSHSRSQASSRAPCQHDRTHGETDRSTRHTHRSHSSRSRRLQFPRRNINARRLHPSAISKLQESLRRGTHEADEVVPVHLYLPPVKLKRVRGSQAPPVQPPPPQPTRAPPPPQVDSVRSLEGQASRALSTPPTFPAGNHSPVTPTQELGDTQPIKERSQWLNDNSNRTVSTRGTQRTGSSAAAARSAASTHASAQRRSTRVAAAATAEAGRGGTTAAAAAAASAAPPAPAGTQAPLPRNKVQNPHLHNSISKRSMLTGSFAQSWLSCFVPIRPLDDVSDHDSECGSDIGDAGAQAAADIKDVAPPPTKDPKILSSKSRMWRSLMRSTGSSHARPTQQQQLQSLNASQMRTTEALPIHDASKPSAPANTQSTLGHPQGTHRNGSDAVRQLDAQDLRNGMRMSCI